MQGQLTESLFLPVCSRSYQNCLKCVQSCLAVHTKLVSLQEVSCSGLCLAPVCLFTSANGLADQVLCVLRPSRLIEMSTVMTFCNNIAAAYAHTIIRIRTMQHVVTPVYCTFEFDVCTVQILHPRELVETGGLCHHA